MQAGVSGTVALLAALAAPAVAAGAQDASLGPSGVIAPSGAASQGAVADIIVTSQRRAQALLDVPLAVSAFPAETLDARGIQNTLALSFQVPNMFASNNTGLGSANAYYLRGLGNIETIATFDPPVGTYVDDVYLSRQNGNNLAFFDVERVEVLRGPQGTLFGRNTTAGAVSLILKRPGRDLSGFVEAGYGRFNRVLLRGSIDLPLDDMLQLKLSAYRDDDKGWAKNSMTGERLNDSDRTGVRFAARLEPVPGLSWNVALAHTRANGESLLDFRCDPANPSDCSGRFSTTGMVEARRLGGGPQTQLPVSGAKADFPLGNRLETTLLTSHLEWAGERHSLALITGVIGMRHRYALDFADGRATPTVAQPVPPVRGFAEGGFAVLNDGTHDQISQEVRLTGSFAEGALFYVAGAYLHDERNRTDFADIVTVDTGTATGPATGTPLLLADRLLFNRTRAAAGYVQVDGRLGAFGATLGLRYTDEEKHLSVRDNRGACVADPTPIGCLSDALVSASGVAVPLMQRTKLWTPRVEVHWRPDDDMLVYASATRGFRSGGWNGRGLRRDQLLPFAPETVWSHEAGLRSSWLDDRLSLGLTAFRLNVDDLQTPSAFVAANGALAFVTQNFAGYRNRGVELELAAVPFLGLNLYLSAGWQDDSYRVPEETAANRFGVKAVRQQQADCRAQLAAGQIPLSPNSAGAGLPPTNAPDCGAGIVTTDGGIATPIRSPDLTLAFGGSWEAAIASAGILLIPSANISYRTAVETGTANAAIHAGASPPRFDGTVFPANPFGGALLTGSRSPAQWLVNASIAIRTDDRTWLVVLECENCLDSAQPHSTLANYVYLNPPRTWTLRARRSF